MSEAKGLYNSPGNAGLAQVIKRGTYLSTLERANARLAKDEQWKAEQVQKKKAEDAKALDDVLKYKPEALLAEYNTGLAKRVNDEYIATAKKYAAEGRINDTDAKLHLYEIQTSIDGDKNRINHFKKDLDEAGKMAIAAANNPKSAIDGAKLMEVLGRIHKRADDSLIPERELNVDDISKAVNSFDVIRQDVVAENFVSGIKELVSYNIKNGTDKTTITGIETNFGKLNATGDGLEIGPDGKPMLNITTSMLERAISDPNMSRIIDHKIANGEAVDKLDALGKTIAPYVYSKEMKPTVSNNPESSRNAKFFGWEEEVYNFTVQRHKINTSIVFDESPTDIGKLVQGPVKSAKIVDNTKADMSIPFIAKPGFTKAIVLEVDSRDSENYTKFEGSESISIKKGKDSLTNTVTIDLSTPEGKTLAYDIINLSQNAGKPSNQQVPTERLTKYHDANGINLMQLANNSFGKKQQPANIATTGKTSITETNTTSTKGTEDGKHR